MSQTKSARLYNCARCHRQVKICSSCDQGNTYCEKDCAAQARAELMRGAGHRYQSTPRGRTKNAARQKRYRQRQKEKATHHDLSVVSPDGHQLKICSPYNRGNIDTQVRAELMRDAGYQLTLRHTKNSVRQQRYRQRQKKIVTHHGSSVVPPHGLLASKFGDEKQAPEYVHQPKKYASLCDFCGCCLGDWLRLDFRQQFQADSVDWNFMTEP